MIYFAIAIIFSILVILFFRRAARIKKRNDEIYKKQAQEIIDRLRREEIFSAIDQEI